MTAAGLGVGFVLALVMLAREMVRPVPAMRRAPGWGFTMAAVWVLAIAFGVLTLLRLADYLS